MKGIAPEGDDLRNAVKWISACLEENPEASVARLIQEATFKYDLSPLDSEFLIRFYSRQQ